jgi:HNH endonuclease
MDLSIYKNQDGSYTSPKNGKRYKSEKALRSHLSFRKTELFHNFNELNQKKVKCTYCQKQYGYANRSNHEKRCYLNPINMRRCEICSKPIKNFQTSHGTCSRSCANTRFRSGEDNGNWRQESYRSTCFRYHKKECVVCKESNIVAVHHMDENRSNNEPSNLIPLCPTHHQYWHSRYRRLIENSVYSYISEWKEKCLGVAQKKSASFGN